LPVFVPHLYDEEKMRNITLQNAKNYYIKYYPALQSFIGCERATLIAGKLEYWFSNPKYEGGFYKFVEPCDHPLYREGDSWSEEVGLSRKIFNRAFDVIGVRYKSKSAFLTAENKFQGKLYASYHDRVTNQTIYVRNHEFASQLFEKVFSKKPSLRLSKKKGKKSKEIPHQNIENASVSEGRSCNSQNGHSCARVSSFIHKKTSSLEYVLPKAPPLEPERQEETEEMIKIWKEEIGDLGVTSVSNGLFTRLQNALKSFFNDSLESWKAYCHTISSSKFLMGEAQNKFFKKAWITWAIKSENIERIKGGDFKLGDRSTNHDREIEVLDTEIRNVEYKKHQIEVKIANIKSYSIQTRKEIVKERIKNLSETEQQKLKRDFEKHLNRENNSMTEEFRKLRWKGLFISSYFDSFVEEKISAELFKETDQDHQDTENNLIRSSGLLDALDDLGYELACLYHKKSLLRNSMKLRGTCFSDSSNS
jgi:hypothetical protein